MTSRFSSRNIRGNPSFLRFLTVMSHEIRTPLNGILGALQLLSETPLKPEQAKLLELAKCSAGELSKMAANVFALSGLDADNLDLDPAPFNPAALIEAACEYWRPAAVSKGLYLEKQVAQTAPCCLLGDARRIRQIIDCYLANAIANTETGGIVVALRTGNLVGTEWHTDAGIYLEVSDTGVGLSRQEQSRLFSELHDEAEDRVNYQPGGVGVGLSICQLLATRMRGSVGVVSTPGAGSRFWVRLPLPAADSMATAIETDAVLADPVTPLTTADGKPPSVLLAEDSITNQLIARAYLEQFGCRVAVVGDGLEAISAVRARRYDIILMDVEMPNMDGLEATRQIRALSAPSARTPIIGLTAYALEEHTRRFLAGGMNYVLNKPLLRESLHRIMREVLVTTNDPGSPGADANQGCIELELSALGRLREQLPASQFIGLLEQVMTDIDAHCEKAIAHAESGEFTELARTCHSLKGLGAGFGCPALERLTNRIHQACLADDAQRAMALTLSELTALSQRTLTALESFQQTQHRIVDH